MRERTKRMAAALAEGGCKLTVLGRTDTERLDALEKAAADVTYDLEGGEWYVYDNRTQKCGPIRSTLRAAIDAYLDAEQQKGGE